MSRPATIVISDWLANCQAGQWTPFEAAAALKEALAKEGYTIEDGSASMSREIAYDQILTLARELSAVTDRLVESERAYRTLVRKSAKKIREASRPPQDIAHD